MVIEMSHDIIDNQKEKLVDHVKKLLHTSRKAHFAVGYLFTSGLKPFYRDLAKLEQVRMIIGNATSRYTIEQLAEAHKDISLVRRAAEKQFFVNPSRKREIIRESQEAIQESFSLMEQSDEDEDLLATLKRLIEEGKLRVRIYTKGRLHSKAYIFDYGPERYEKGTVIIGSSNLSFSGLVDNTELNAVLAGNANHERLSQWFNELWKNSEPFDKALLTEIDRSWALNEVRPYDIYIKTLYCLLKDRLEGEKARELLWEHTMPPLTKFQMIAVRQALQILHDYDAVIVGDVVGVGKTFIGVGLLKHLQMVRGARVLVIAPASIVQYWDELLKEYGVIAEVLSMGVLSQGTVDLDRDPRYRDCDTVLIDESHNFRYPNTNRYRTLQPFLYGKKVILVTATPRNNTHWDIFHQIKLFHHEDPTLLPIDPPYLRAFFKLIDEGKARIQDLLRLLLIRRTRKHILQWYGDDDERGRRYIPLGKKRFYFPDRELNTVTYSIDETYSHLYDKILEKLSEFQYAKYGLWNFVKPGMRDKSPYRELERSGQNLRELMKVLLFKRFESSVYAFRETIKRLTRIHESFLNALDEGIIPAGEEAQELLYEAEAADEQLLMELELVSRRYEAKAFLIDELRRNIQGDLETLSDIERMVAPITPEDDDKLQQLHQIMNSAGAKGKKTIIFTQYADTARYVYQNLRNPLEIALVHSKQKNRLHIIRLFAPKSNNYQIRKGEEELQTLVSTDVLSEGLNLQDASVVINYDLHWNPVRLIQRIGRVDRMGALAEIIDVYNFLPERALERHLHLHERIRRRIQEIHETIGEDEKILEKSERLNEESMYAILEREDSAALDDYEAEFDAFGQELFGLSEAEELIRLIQRENPDYFEYIKDLPDGVRSAKHCADRLNYIFCQSGDYQKLYLTDAGGHVKTDDMATILSLIKCEREENPIPVPKGFNKCILKIRGLFAKRADERAAVREVRVTLKPQQRYILNHLQKLYENIDDPEKRSDIERLRAAIRAPLPPIVLQALNRYRREGTSGDILFEKVKEIYFQYRLPKYIESEERETIRTEPVKIVCSMAMISEKKSGSRNERR